MRERRLTDRVIGLATQLRGQDVNWIAIATYLGVNTQRLRARLDPEYIAETQVMQKRLLDSPLTYEIPSPPLLRTDPLLDRLRAVGHDFAE